MSRKPVISKEFIGSANNGGSAQAVSADYTSEILNVRQTDIGSLHIVWSGGSSANIDIYVQVRNGDDKQDTWRTLDLGAVPNISGTSGEHEIVFTEMPFADLRVFFDRNAGSANVDATFVFKAKGA